MAEVMLLTREELLERREALLAEAGVSEDELRRRGRAYDLDLHGIALLDELDEIDYLLGQ